MQAMLFSADHAWARDDGDYFTIGISDHAQEMLGPLVNVDLPAVGSTISRNSPCGMAESTKTASDIIAPLTGKVVAINEAVVNDPTLVNDAAEAEGWLFRLVAAEGGRADPLMSRDAYLTGL